MVANARTRFLPRGSCTGLKLGWICQCAHGLCWNMLVYWNKWASFKDVMTYHLLWRRKPYLFIILHRGQLKPRTLLGRWHLERTLMLWNPYGWWLNGMTSLQVEHVSSANRRNQPIHLPWKDSVLSTQQKCFFGIGSVPPSSLLFGFGIALEGTI
jgi:hypothetical protein